MRVVSIAAVMLASFAQAETPPPLSSWSGTLLDAGCNDRSLDNLRAQPADRLAMSKEPQRSAEGIRVDPRIVQAERAEAALPHTPDHASRYASASCALTADTKSFMLLLGDGTLLNLDEGGNTLALEAFQSTAAGHAILNGKVGGLKPPVTIAGVRAGGRLKVKSVELRQPSSQQAAPAK